MTTVYEKTHTYCAACNTTKRWLDKHGIPYDAKSIEDNMDVVRELLPDATSAPVVITDTDVWFGFRPDKLKEL